MTRAGKNNTDRAAAAADESALQYGRAAIDAQRPDEAERVARQVLARQVLERQVLGRQPQHKGAQHLLGLALLIQKRAREAVEPLADVARDTADPLIETHYALALRDVGRTAEAIDWLKRAMSRTPAFAPAFHELGLLYCGMRRYEEAEATLKQGIDLAPSVAELSVELGGVYICRADPANAKIAFARALAQAPAQASSHVPSQASSHVRALHGFGTAFLFEGEFERAAERFRQVLARSPEHVRARLDLAHCLLELGRFDDGVAELRTVVRTSPRHYGKALKMLASSRRGRFWLRPSMAASFLNVVSLASSLNLPQ